MGFGDFAPPSSGRAKYISKKELKKLQDNFAKADEISQQVRKREAEEQKKASQEIDGLLDEII